MALGVAYGFAGPVSGVLVHAGQIVEQGTFAHIWISGNGDDPIIFGLLLNEKAGIDGAQADGIVGQPHRKLLSYE